jgi:hypothetical protein
MPKLGLICFTEYVRPLPNRYVRVRSDGSVFIGVIDGKTDTDSTNAEFKKVPGLSDSNCVSFESSMFPGRFLRNRGNDIVLDSRPWGWSPDFDERATFRAVDRGGQFAYESVRRPGSYVQRNGTALRLRSVSYPVGDLGDENFNFFEVEGPVTLNVYHGGSVSASPLVENDGDYVVVTYIGDCTGLTPWFGTPPRKTLEWRVQYRNEGMVLGLDRLVKSTATASTLVGFRPWIKFYVTKESVGNTRMQGDVSKIITGVIPCIW